MPHRALRPPSFRRSELSRFRRQPELWRRDEALAQLKCTLRGMGRILFVRHGQSEWNAQGRWQGQADISLSDLGRRQARAATKNLGSFDVIAASPLARAAETAYIFSTELGIGPIVPVPELVERSAGEWSGLTRDDITRDWPGYLEEGKRPPSYENDDELWQRILPGLETVFDMLGPNDEALVVAHGGLIYLLEDRCGTKQGPISNVGAIWLSQDPNGEIVAGERVELIDESDVRTAQGSDVL